MADTTMKQKLEFLDLDDLNAPDRQRLEDLFAADNPHVELLAPTDYLATGGWFGGISGSVNGHQSGPPCEVYQESVEVLHDLVTPPTDLARDNLSSAVATPDHTTSQGNDAYELCVQTANEDSIENYQWSASVVYVESNVFRGEDEKMLDEPTEDISDIPKPGSHINSSLDNNIATPLAPQSTQSLAPNTETFINTPTAATTNYAPPSSSYTGATSPAIPVPNSCSNNIMDGVPVASDTPREYNVPPPHIPQHGEGGVPGHGSSHGNHPTSTHVLQPTAPVYSPQQPYPALAVSPNANPTVFNPHVLPPPPPPHHQSPAAAAAAPPYGQMTHQMMQAPQGPTVYVQNCHVNVSPYGATSVHNQNVHNQHAGHGPTAASVQNQQVHQHAVHNQYNVHQHIAAAAAAQAGGPVASHNSQSPGPVVPGQVMPPMAMVHDPASHMQHGMKPLDKGDYDGSKQQQQQQQHQRFEQQTYYRGGYGGGRGGRGRGRGGGRGGRGRGQPIPHHERSNSVSSDHSAYGSEKSYQETSPTPYTGMPQSQFVPNPYAHMYMPRTPYPVPYGAAAGHMAAAAASQNVQGLPLIYHQQQYQQQQQQQQQFLAHYQQSPHNQGQLVTYTPVSSQGNAGQVLHHPQQQQQLQQHQVPTSHQAPQHPHYHPSVHHYQQQVPAAPIGLTSPEQPFQPPHPTPQPTQPMVPVAVVSRPPDPADNTKIHLVSEVPQGIDVATHVPVDHDEPAPSNSEVYEVVEEPQIENLSKDVADLKLEEEFEENSENFSDNIPVQNAVSFQPANQISKDIVESKEEIEQTDSVIEESAVPTSAVSIASSPAVIIVGNPIQESLNMSNCSLGKVEFTNGSFSNTTDLGLSFTVDDEIFPLDSSSMETTLNIDCTTPAVELPTVKPPPSAVELPNAKPQVVVQTTHVAVEMPKTAIHPASINSMKDAIPVVENVIKKSSPSVSPIMIIPEPTKAVAHPTKVLETVLVSGPVDTPAAQLPSPASAAPVSTIDKAPASGIVSGSGPGLSTASPALPLPQDDAAVPPPVPVGAWAQKKSWSDLFTKKQEDGTAKQVAYVAPFNQQQEAAAVAANAASDPQQEQSMDGSAAVSVPSPSTSINNAPPQESTKIILPAVAEEDIEKAKMGEMLRQYQQDHRHWALQPRGLINKGYWCYVNAPLQALLACPPFYNLLTAIPTISGLKKGKSTTPVIDSITEYVHEFSEMSQILKPSKKDKDPKGVRKEPELVCGSPFEPVYVHKLLSSLSGDLFTEGRQQDAEEMLSAVLNGLHDEMVEALKLAGEDFSSSGSVGGLNGDISDHEEYSDNNDDDEWQVMGPKKRSVITRTAHFTPSPISNIFWGMMRSNLQQAGGQVTANLQPFTTLPLDIQSPNVETVRDALDQLVSREDVSGYTCSKTNQEVAVSKQVVIEHLPNVLILQLKRFIYDKDGGLQKVSKKVGFPLNLEITKELMSSNSRGKYSSTQRKFKLLGVIYHDGKEATKGHYVADIYHSGYNCWLRYDDSVVKVVAEQQMLKHAPPRVPYMLFYRRQDTMVGPTTKVKA